MRIDIVELMLRISMLIDVFEKNVDEVGINEMFEMNNMYNDIDFPGTYVVFDNDNPSRELY